jgi:hypothetical protein
VSVPFRRDFETLLATHTLDPDRCELLVEGEEDRRILLWLVGDAINPGAVITPIEKIDVDCSFGGNRERLLEVARQLEDAEACILCFVDSGLGEVEEVDLRSIVMTDGPDIESYVLRPECIEKFLRLGLRTDAWDPEQLLEMVLQQTRRLGLLRIASDAAGWDLPFRRTEIHRHVELTTGGEITIDEQSFVGSLLQNCDMSLSCREDVIRNRDELEASLLDLDDRALTHGKDALGLLAEVAVKAGTQRKDSRGILWATLERRLVDGEPGLERILCFLERCCGCSGAPVTN